MKRFCITLFILFSLNRISFSQAVQGEIIQNNNPYIIKVWGNHFERGYAVGFILGAQISDIYSNYVAPQFGSNLALAKLMIQQGLFNIDSVYISEAQGVINGITAAGFNTQNMDYLDVLIGNTFLDFQNISSFKNLIKSPGCSSLISWGDATSGSELSGKSIITRHLDWSTDPSVINNQAIVVHFPSDPGEQPWLLVGFAGQLGVLSGVNQSGLGLFQHSMSDSYSPGSSSAHYEPIWFCIRRTLESNDINNDGVCNTLDFRAAALENTNGFADGFIVSAIAPNIFSNDSLCAMISELAPSMPYAVFRDNSFPDSIPGDNIYAANYEIERNNHMHFCFRYNQTKNALDAINGQDIGRNESWSIMADSSNAGFGNVQMMQYIPEDNELMLATHPGDAPAYIANPVLYDLNSLFTLTENDLKTIQRIRGFPNPARETFNIFINGIINCDYQIKVFDINGKVVLSSETSKNLFSFSVENLESGIYAIIVSGEGNSDLLKLIISK